MPVEIKSLLHEFKEFVFDDLLKGLPPVRSISYQINLIPGSRLPNKAPYGMAPVESEDANIQVHDLLDRGMIRESLSPCPIRTVLAPKKTGDWRMCINSRAIN